ncbi:MAG: hypothetical protein U0572_08470 [Phycisphaerales bacterium]
MSQLASQVLGWVPAIVFPTASLLQFAAILKAGTARGVSIASWSLFALANICLYVYLGKFTEPQAILSGLGTASCNLLVVGAAIRFRGNARSDS